MCVGIQQSRGAGLSKQIQFGEKQRNPKFHLTLSEAGEASAPSRVIMWADVSEELAEEEELI